MIGHSMNNTVKSILLDSINDLNVLAFEAYAAGIARLATTRGKKDSTVKLEAAIIMNRSR